jgi:ADP-ribosylglycohydrolase
MTYNARFRGALLGLAYGDAISFPALFHRFESMPRRRHQFVWRQNKELGEMGIGRMTLPFTHRMPAHHLEPSPTDDTEFALLTLNALLDDPNPPSQQTFLTAWQTHMLPAADELHTSFSERAAIENLRRGLLPPVTGNDNPLHYEDSAVARAVPIGLFCVGQPDEAAALAQLDTQITQAEDGVWAARGMAAAIALLSDGAAPFEAAARARAEFPAESWIAHGDAIAISCRDEATSVEDLALLLSRQLINTVYSYGNAAPETFPAALVLFEKCEGDLLRATAAANMIAKSADSLPAMVGALCGALQGEGVVPAAWREALDECRGYCLPFLAGMSIVDAADRLYERTL